MRFFQKLQDRLVQMFISQLLGGLCPLWEMEEPISLCIGEMK